MMGVKLLQGMQREDGTYSDMYSCWFRGGDFSILGFPENELQGYRGLWGLLKDGSPMTHNGEPVLYMFPSDPKDENGWSECSELHPPSDRRLFMSIGPVTMEHLEQKEFHFAVLWIRDNIEYPCPSFAPIQEAADCVQDLFDSGLITSIEGQPTPQQQHAQIHLFPNPFAAEESSLKSIL